MNSSSSSFSLPWWCDPALALPVVSVPVAICTFWLPPEIYRWHWKTGKYFNEWYLLCCLAAVVVFCLTCAVAKRTMRREPDAGVAAISWPVILRAFDIATVLCLAGYLAWAISAVSRGAGLSEALAVVSGVKGASERMKEIYMVTIPGVTTFTQLGIASVVLGCLAATHYPARRVAPGLAAIGVAALLRAVMNSERLALIELALPGILIACRVLLPRLRGSGLWSPRVLAIAPAGGLAAVFLLFSGFEYFRSWTNFYSGGGSSFWEFTTARFTGYFTTALNNGAFLSERLSPLNVPYFSLPFVWRFPVVKELSVEMLSDFPFARENPILSLLSRGANPEFNNGGGLLLPYVDLGLSGMLVFWSAVGATAGVSYAAFQRASLGGLLIYPILYTGLVEAPRVIYFTEGRVFPAWCAVASVWIYCRLQAGRSAGARVENQGTAN